MEFIHNYYSPSFVGFFYNYCWIPSQVADSMMLKYGYIIVYSCFSIVRYCRRFKTRDVFFQMLVSVTRGSKSFLFQTNDSSSSVEFWKNSFRHNLWPNSSVSAIRSTLSFFTVGVNFKPFYNNPISVSFKSLSDNFRTHWLIYQ